MTKPSEARRLRPGSGKRTTILKFRLVACLCFVYSLLASQCDVTGDDDDVVRCFIEATLKHSEGPGAVRASKMRYPFLRPVISRGCQG